MVEREMHRATGSGWLAISGVAMAVGFLGMLGVLAVAVIWPSPARTWIPTAATVISSDYGLDRASEQPYVAEIRYAYTVGDAPYESANTYMPEQRFADFQPVQRLLAAYPAGTTVVCYVNPVDPQQAVLRHRPPWGQMVALAGFAGLVALGGIGLLALVIGRRSVRGQFALPPSPLGGVVRIVRAIRWVVSVCSVVGGLAVFLFFFSQPLRLLIVSRSWTAVPATVVASGVQTRTYPWGQFFRVDVLYEYVVAGERWRSNGHGPSALPTTNRSGVQQEAASYPVGRQVTCFVAPHDPVQAILERSVPPALVLAVLPLFLAVSGMAGIWRLLGPITASFAGRGLRRPARELSLSSRPVPRLFVLLLVTVAWIAAAIPFVCAIAESFIAGRPEWLPALFIGVYLAVGLVLAGVAVAQFLAMFNARPRLWLAPGDIVPGAEMALQWLLAGRTDRVSVLTITAICRKITHRRRIGSRADGSPEESDTEVAEVYVQELVTVRRAADIQAGRVAFVMPMSVPPTTSLGSTRHVWCLRVVGEIVGWPDIEHEFEVEVIPSSHAEL